MSAQPLAAVGRSIKCGVGRVTATAIPTTGNNALLSGPPSITRLTEVAHLSPTRIIPMLLTSVASAGASLAAVSSYGGGMVRGDRQDLTVHVEEGARLGLVTQGATRIYRSGSLASSPQPSSSSSWRRDDSTDGGGGGGGEEDPTCRATLHAKVSSNGVLVVAPDPLVPFSRSSFDQRQRIDLGPGASLILVDWFSAGRVVNGERWDFDRVSSRTELRAEGDPVPFLLESVLLDRRFALGGEGGEDPFGFDSGLGSRFDAFASVLIHGPAGHDVSSSFASLSRSLGGSCTRIREQEDLSDDDGVHLQHDISVFGGRVLLGLSKVEHRRSGSSDACTTGETYVARIAATSNEDMYRVLHSCLRPLKDGFGVEFYKDRIHGSSTSANSVSAKLPELNEQTTEKQPRHDSTSTNTSRSSILDGHSAWSALMLADTGLPTGSFAHSAGIEAASQLGLFGNQTDPDHSLVSNYIRAATRSATQLLTPFALGGHALVASRTTKTDENIEAIYREWLVLDRYAHATLVANGPGCRASLDQGHGLLRVAIQWLRGAGRQQSRHVIEGAVDVLQLIQREVDQSSSSGHVGPLFGLIGGYLGLSSDVTCRVLGYCAARDMMSSAVRLNLIGPLSGVSVLDGVWSAVDEGTGAALASMADAKADANCSIEENDFLLAGIKSAAGCSPVVEAVHPTHDLLAVRLFRT